MNINGPVTLTLPPEHFAQILEALAERPYKIAQPIIAGIITQLQEKNNGAVEGN